MSVNDYYNRQRKEAEEFQDWLMLELNKRGIIIQIFTSKEYQYAHGETPARDEIKFDKEALRYPNLWIEFYEKKYSENLNYVKSGILRENIIRWFHGNYEWVYIFDKRRLLEYILNNQKKGRFQLKENIRKTSMGALLPQSEANSICSRKIRFNEPDIIKSVVITKNCTFTKHTVFESREEEVLSKWGI